MAATTPTARKLVIPAMTASATVARGSLIGSRFSRLMVTVFVRTPAGPLDVEAESGAGFWRLARLLPLGFGADASGRAAARVHPHPNRFREPVRQPIPRPRCRHLAQEQVMRYDAWGVALWHSGHGKRGQISLEFKLDSEMPRSETGLTGAATCTGSMTSGFGRLRRRTCALRRGTVPLFRGTDTLLGAPSRRRRRRFAMGGTSCTGPSTVACTALGANGEIGDQSLGRRNLPLPADNVRLQCRQCGLVRISRLDRVASIVHAAGGRGALAGRSARSGSTA